MFEEYEKFTGGDKVILDVAGNNAFLMDDAMYAYIVLAGKVDLFAVPVSGGEPCGARCHLFQSEAGAVLFAFAAETIAREGVGLLVSGSIGTRIQRIPRSCLELLAQDEAGARPMAESIDQWLNTFSDTLLRDGPPTIVDQRLSAGRESEVKAGATIGPEEGVLWVSQTEGRSLFLGPDGEMSPGIEERLPLTGRTWLSAASDGLVVGIPTMIWFSLDPQWSALDLFHTGALKIIRGRIEEAGSLERERMTRKSLHDRQAMSGSVRELAELLVVGEQHVHPEGVDLLLDVCRKVATQLGITIVEPPAAVRKRRSRDPLADIVRSSRIRARRVALHGEWWQDDNGPLVAFRDEGKTPVALLQKSPRRYHLYDPTADGVLTPVTREVAEGLDPFAHTLYRTFPCRVLKGKELLSFAAKGRGADIAVVIVTGIAGGILGLVTPVATGVIFDTIIPGAQLNQLLMLAMALLVGAVSTAVFGFTKSIAILRLEGRMDQHVQGAVWDRLLELPVPFFREFSSGDLADRAMGINAIRQTLSGTTINAILSGIFSIFNLILLFWYSTKLAIAAVVLTLVAIIFLAITSRFQLGYQKELASIGGKLSGFVLESITGIAKYRVSGSEGRVFSKWVEKFAEQRRISNKSRIAENIIETFSAVYPVISTIIIFVMIVWFSKKNPLSTGSFLAFTSSFGQFLQSVLGVAMSVISTVSILPLYQRCKPILETLPETDDARAHPGELTGAIEVSRLSFRYTPDGPLILDDVSLQINPGEFIALVGQSGSGKSTLLRLLLGFENADSGGIFFDGQDISTLDIRSVRQQMGVVLQNGQLMSGDIFTNIVGSSLMTIDDAWEAARMTGFEDDVKAMPMGMHTVVSQGGGTLSGGQRQRLLIARAIVARPRILFFDEATSALDNLTQAIVNSSLEKLQTTRVVIAHRLSTIINADRIYVLDQGRIVQSGSYDELMASDGLFAELARRQIA